MQGTRTFLLCLVLFTGSAVVSGCLADGEELDQASGPNETAVAEDAGQNTSDDPGPAGNGTEARASQGSSNETSEEDAGPEGNQTDPDGNATETNHTASKPDEWPAPADAPIRPGIAINPFPFVFPDGEGGSCTANFLFSSSDTGALLLGTAGHCIEDDKTANLTGDGTYEAEVVWAADNETVDFGLMALNRSYVDELHPKMLYWGGPTGTDPAPAAGTELRLFGSTSLRGGYDEVSRFRGVVTAQCDGRIYAQVPGTGPGDSGAPAITEDGEAIGWLLGPSPGFCSDLTPKQAIRFMPIEAALAYAEADLAVDLELVTWDDVHPDRLPTP